VQVNGKRYTNDILIRADGKIKDRKRKGAQKGSGSGRGLGIDEVTDACKGNAQTLVVGTGMGQRLAVGNEVRLWLDKKGVKLVTASSPQAVTEYRTSRGPRALLLHLRD
jgi:hypothetical protein